MLFLKHENFKDGYRRRQDMEAIVSKDIVKVILPLQIDSKNASAFEQELFAEMDKNEGREVLLDAKNMKYISSAGLRVFLKLRKRVGMEIPVVNVSDDVYDVFEMTNFTDMFDVSRKMRSVSLGGKEVLFRGINGMTYQLDDDTMVNVFRKGTRIKDIKKEREYSHTALVCGVPALIPYDVVSVADSYGIVMESDHATTLAEAVRKEPGRIETYAEQFAVFLKEIHQVEIEDGQFPDIKDRYREWLEKAGKFIANEDLKKITKLIENIPDSNGFIHGDMSPNNILMQNGEFYLLDMAGAAHGHAIFDLQGLYASLIMLEKERPSYCSTVFRLSGKDCKKFWDFFFAKYMEGAPKEQIEKMQQLLSQYYILKQKLLDVLE